MNDTILTLRQIDILTIFGVTAGSDNVGISREALAEHFAGVDKNISRVTLIRELNALTKLGWLEKQGKARATKYCLAAHAQTLLPIDLNKFFENEPDKRLLSKTPIDIEKYINILTPDELAVFEQGKQKLTTVFNSWGSDLIKKELERFVIELSWKSSQIEGNTYSLLETEELIKNKKEALNHSQDEATMILNHKEVFDQILAKKDEFKTFSEHDLKTIHTVLIKDLNVQTGYREHLVGIVGTKYSPPENKWFITESLKKLFDVKTEVPELALLTLAFISLIQPFADGNKRTARMSSNAILLANGYFPLSYRSVDEIEYKKALVLFYEQGNIYHLKRLFVEQQKFAIENYFR